MMPYQLRDTVSGALSGQHSVQTLELLIDSFGFSEHEAGRLRLWAGSTTIGVMSGTMPFLCRAT